MERDEWYAVHKAHDDRGNIDETGEDARLDRDLDAELAQLIQQINAPPQLRATEEGKSANSSQEQNNKGPQQHAYPQESTARNSGNTTYNSGRPGSKEEDAGAVQSINCASAASAIAGLSDIPTQEGQLRAAPLRSRGIASAARNRKGTQPTAAKLTTTCGAAKKPSRSKEPSQVAASASPISATASSKRALPAPSTPASSLSKTGTPSRPSALPKATHTTAKVRRKRSVAVDSIVPCLKGISEAALTPAGEQSSAIAANAPAGAPAGLGSPKSAASVRAVAVGSNRRREAVASKVVKRRASRPRATLPARCSFAGKEKLAEDGHSKCQQATTGDTPARWPVGRGGSGKHVRALAKTRHSVIVPPTKIPRKAEERPKEEGRASLIHSINGVCDLDITGRTYASHHRRDPERDLLHSFVKRKQAQERQQYVRHMQGRAEPVLPNINFRLRLTFPPQSWCPPLELEGTTFRTSDGEYRFVIQTAKDVARSSTCRRNRTEDEHDARSTKACSRPDSVRRGTSVKRRKEGRLGGVSARAFEQGCGEQSRLGSWGKLKTMF